MSHSFFKERTMKHAFTLFSLLLMGMSQQTLANTETDTKTNPVQPKVSDCPATLNFNFRQLSDARQVNLCEQYKGKVLLIVNTASRCGFTPQFEPLEALYKKYKDQGFAVLGFPSNDFGNQDPGTEKEIADFCSLTYGVKFPMFEKTHAMKSAASPFYKTLGEIAGEYPQWNFHKYLLDKDGKLIASFASQVSPTDTRVTDMIEKNL